jgi:hypothetical protein
MRELHRSNVALPVQQPHRVGHACGDPDTGLNEVYDGENAYRSGSALRQNRKQIKSKKAARGRSQKATIVRT